MELNGFDKGKAQPYHQKSMLYKRGQVLINKRFQLKFAFFVCSWIFALSMIYPILIYNVFEYFLKLAQSGQVQGVAVSVDRIRALENQMLMFLGVLQLLFLGITFLLSIFLSHRIAGPIHKLRKSMEEVSKGNFDLRISFRKNDHFMELQDTFNEMMQHLSIRRWR